MSRPHGRCTAPTQRGVSLSSSLHLCGYSRVAPDLPCELALDKRLFVDVLVSPRSRGAETLHPLDVEKVTLDGPSFEQLRHLMGLVLRFENVPGRSSQKTTTRRRRQTADWSCSHPASHLVTDPTRAHARTRGEEGGARRERGGRGTSSFVSTARRFFIVIPSCSAINSSSFALRLAISASAVARAPFASAAVAPVPERERSSASRVYLTSTGATGQIRGAQPHQC